MMVCSVKPYNHIEFTHPAHFCVKETSQVCTAGGAVEPRYRNVCTFSSEPFRYSPGRVLRTSHVKNLRLLLWPNRPVRVKNPSLASHRLADHLHSAEALTTRHVHRTTRPATPTFLAPHVHASVHFSASRSTHALVASLCPYS